MERINIKLQLYFNLREKPCQTDQQETKTHTCYKHQQLTSQFPVRAHWSRKTWDLFINLMLPIVWLFGFQYKCSLNYYLNLKNQYCKHPSPTMKQHSRRKIKKVETSMASLWLRFTPRIKISARDRCKTEQKKTKWKKKKNWTLHYDSREN